MSISLKRITASLFITMFSMLLISSTAHAESRAKLQADARQALEDLYKTSPGARALARDAKGILVFPSIVKGGFVVGASYGDGVLFKGDSVAGYYNSTAGSFGFQAGLQKFGYALFLMTDADLRYLDKSDGWELGVGPSITIVDQGIATSLTTTTAREGVYAFFFEQKGLMAGVGIQGTKITRIHPK
jgi:lipid-binding SYLF domain-containing protein